MTLLLAIFGAVLVIGAVGAVFFRNLVHCALALAVSFTGLAAVYLQLNAEFVGWVQLFVYVGAVAILVLFAVLLTRGGEPANETIFSPGWGSGVLVALAVFAVLGKVVMSTRLLPRTLLPPPEAPVKAIGDLLMTKYILPLEVIGLLLTVALIGAVLIAMREKGDE